MVGALDLERALTRGEKSFEPGLLARANRGFLYIDEVNLLEDHLVDLLLDVAASGENVVERDGLSIRHPAKIVLVGTGNPEEGELRPQLLDRFGLPSKSRPRRTCRRGSKSSSGAMPSIRSVRLCRAMGEAGGDVAQADLLRTRTHQSGEGAGTGADQGGGTLHGPWDRRAAWRTNTGARRACPGRHRGRQVRWGRASRRVAPSSLRHRLRRNPLDDFGSTARVERALAECFPA